MKIKEFAEIKYGKNQSKVLDENGEYPIIGTGGIFGLANNYLYNKPSVLIGRKGSINNPMYYDKPFWTVDTLFYTIINEKAVIPRWFYYYLTTIDLNKYNEGTTIPSLTTKTLYEIEVPSHSIKYQQHIVDIIGSIDDKIENNSKIISSIDKLMLLDFRKNYDLAKNIKTYTINLKDIIELKTGKKDANASIEKGHYPFFTCSEKDSKIAEYSFDQEAIIIAGNGNMSVKYYKGKFDAYQRTYIIKPNKYTCYLYLFYKTFINDISQGARGSVIKFLTRSMLEEIEVHILSDDKMNEFEILNIERLNFIQKLKKENKSLEKTKALYLKKFFD